MKKLRANIKYWLLLTSCRIVGLLPTWFLYHVLLDVLYFSFYKVGRYRLQTVRKNLKNAFPEKNPEELLRIEKGFYRHLAEIMVDTVDLVSISRRELEKRIIFEGLKEHERQLAGREWIAALAHYGSWEYFMAYQFHTRYQVVGVYRKLRDEAFDRLYRYSRSRFGMKPVEAHSVMRYVARNRKEDGPPSALGLIADQSPHKLESHWFEFLNQNTSFFVGIERQALAFGMPVYFMDVRKTSRARYRVRFEQIYDGVEKVDEGVITDRYVRRLEEMIRARPEYWMWSHRRWKHKMRKGSTLFKRELSAGADGEADYVLTKTIV